jgi:hypothetical protein
VLTRTRPLNRTSQYASARDFCFVFHQDMDILYWLALTLTSDELKAEECFVAGLDECIYGNSVFKECARSWSRRMVIKNAIRVVSPRPGMPSASLAVRTEEMPGSPAQTASAVLSQMQSFDRFVFVMSVLEGYANRDCATLLRCSSTDVAQARVRALRQIPRESALSLNPVDDRSNECRESLLYSVDVA